MAAAAATTTSAALQATILETSSSRPLTSPPLHSVTEFRAASFAFLCFSFVRLLPIFFSLHLISVPPFLVPTCLASARPVRHWSGPWSGEDTTAPCLYFFFFFFFLTIFLELHHTE